MDRKNLTKWNIREQNETKLNKMEQKKMEYNETKWNKMEQMYKMEQNLTMWIKWNKMEQTSWAGSATLEIQVKWAKSKCYSG